MVLASLGGHSREASRWAAEQPWPVSDQCPLTPMTTKPVRMRPPAPANPERVDRRVVGSEVSGSEHILGFSSTGHSLLAHTLKRMGWAVDNGQLQWFKAAWHTEGPDQAEHTARGLWASAPDNGARRALLSALQAWTLLEPQNASLPAVASRLALLTVDTGGD